METLSSPQLNSSTINSQDNQAEQEISRRSAGYHPSIWGDHFITSIPITTVAEEENRIEMLKENVQKLLGETKSNPLEQLMLIDTLQRLGIAYHFEHEIEEALHSIYIAQINNSGDDVIYNNLYIVSLRFRLLRQQGYNVSSDIFKSFVDEHDEFKVSLTKDTTRDMLCLYNASQLRIQGEDILEEALVFSSNKLKSLITHNCSLLANQVKCSLDIPFHKGMPRLEARQYISIYEKDPMRNDILLELAKLDFNMLQILHQGELGEISRWWKNLDFASKLSFARDRLVECYFWILGVHFEPKYSASRIYVTKLIAIASVIDDIYDVYGTLEELEQFIDAIERWEASAANKLPEYMKVCYIALFDVVQDIEDKMIDEGRSYRASYAKEAMRGLIRAYYAEAKWFHCGYFPTFEEYLGVSVISSGYPMLCVQSLICMDNIATKEAFEWVVSVPKIVKSCGLIARLVDDIQTHKVEQERGDAPSGVECYMKQYGVSEEEACKNIKRMVENAWKDINEECQKPSKLPLPLLLPALNLARVMEVMYQYGDGYTNSSGRTKDHIASLLVNPISI